MKLSDLAPDGYQPNKGNLDDNDPPRAPMSPSQYKDIRDRTRSVSEEYFGYEGPEERNMGSETYINMIKEKVLAEDESQKEQELHLAKFRGRILSDADRKELEHYGYSDQDISTIQGATDPKSEARYRDLQEQGYSQKNIISIMDVEEYYRNEPAKPGPAYEPEHKRPIINTRFIKNALEKGSLSESIGSIETIIKDTIKEELSKADSIIEDSPVLVDRVAHIKWNNDSYTDSNGHYHTDHPNNINIFMSNILINHGEIVSVQHLNKKSELGEHIVMIHYKTPRDI